MFDTLKTYLTSWRLALIDKFHLPWRWAPWNTLGKQLNKALANPQSLFALLTGSCILLLGMVFPSFEWIESQLFYARLPQERGLLPYRVLALQLDESEEDEFIDFLNTLPAHTFKAMGVCSPELMNENFAKALHHWQQDKQTPLLLASTLKWQDNQWQLHQSRSQSLLSGTPVGYIAPVSVYSMVYAVNKPFVYQVSATTADQPLLQALPAFSQNMLQALNQPSIPQHETHYLPTPDGFSPPMSLRQMQRLSSDNLLGSVLLVGHAAIENGQWISPLQTEAHALKGLLRRETYHRSELGNFLICLLLMLSTIVLFNLTLSMGIWLACGSVCTLLLSYFTLNIVAFRVAHFWLDLALPLGAALGALGALIYYFQLTEGRTRQQLLSTYRRHLPDKVVRELMESPAEELGQNERRIVTVMFTDIEGFSRMGEELPPDQIINILNEYLSAMTEIIFANNGSLDKYMGDGIMAVYGNIGANDPAGCAYYAVKTALEMQKKMTELQKKWMKEGIRPIQIRIGINTGDALVGNVGHPKRKELTVIGDTVNTCNRIERLNKQYNTHILISHGTYLYVKNKVDIEALGEEQLQGKQSSVKVYHVKGWLKEPVS